jgi:hypothetical protein
MPRSQPPRRKPTQRPPRRETIARGIAALSEVLSVNRTVADCAPGEQALRIESLRHAVDQLSEGQCTEKMMADLIDAANIAGFRLDDGDFQEATLPVRAAKAAVESLYETHQANGRYIAHSFELNNLRDFINHYEIMMQNSTPKEWNTAQRKMEAAYSRIHRHEVAA